MITSTTDAYAQRAATQKTRSATVQSGPRAVRATTRLSLAFSNVNVREVLATIADYARIDILLTPGAAGQVSINLRNRTPDDAIRLVAAAAGLSVTRTSGAYLVGPAAEVRQAAAEFEQAARGGRPLAPASIVTLHAADPASAERILRGAFPNLQVTREERTLVLSGSPTDLTAAGQALQALDVEAPKVAEATEVFVYRVNFLNTERAVAALKSALPNLTVTPAPEPIAPPPATLNTIVGNGFQSIGGSGSGGAGTGGGVSASGGTSAGAASQPLSRTTRLILIGVPADIQAARSLLAQTDLAQPQVRIEAALVEVNRNDLTDLGVRFDYRNGIFGLGTNGFGFSVPGGTNTTSPLTGRGNINGSAHGGPNNFAVTLNALITQGKARILASPNITVVDNEDASVFIGDYIRFPGQTTITTGGTTITSTEAVPVGIALVVRPRIHPDGQVTLKVHPAVSTITGYALNLPQIASREADTTVRLRYGEEFVIGGLLSTQELKSIDKVPLLGDIPILGELFKSRRITNRRTEIVVIIRAYPALTEPAPPHDFRQDLKDQGIRNPDLKN